MNVHCCNCLGKVTIIWYRPLNVRSLQIRKCTYYRFQSLEVYPCPGPSSSTFVKTCFRWVVSRIRWSWRKASQTQTCTLCALASFKWPKGFRCQDFTMRWMTCRSCLRILPTSRRSKRKMRLLYGPSNMWLVLFKKGISWVWTNLSLARALFTILVLSVWASKLSFSK
jgi:hypothetical protein